MTDKNSRLIGNVGHAEKYWQTARQASSPGIAPQVGRGVDPVQWPPDEILGFQPAKSHNARCGALGWVLLP